MGPVTFAAARNFTTGDSPVSVVVAHVNRDGRPDLAIVSILAIGVSVLLRNGTGTFKSP